jgi:glucosylglycerate synthase
LVSAATDLNITETKLAEESFLTDDYLHQLINVGEVDILVGLPTHNNSKTIGSVVNTIQSGILREFPRERTVIVNVDGGSHDGTPALITGVSIDDARPASTLYALRTMHSISTKYASSPASEVAFRSILAAAELLRAKACVVISPESANIEPDWLPKLLCPIYRDGFDFVAPTYRRHKFEGLLITNLLYPMTRALYGLRLREAYAPEFGFSGRLGTRFLEQNVWTDGTGETSVELRFTLAAIAGKYRISQAFLGEKINVDRNSADLVPALRRTVGALFSALEPDFPFWSAVTRAEAVPTAGAEQEMLLHQLRVNRKRLREMFSRGVVELESVFQAILSPTTLAELRQIARLTEEQFCYPAELWVKTVYEFAASYQKSVISRDHIIQALAPLFRGRVVTFLTENRNAVADEVEDNIEKLCVEFERLKPYLLEMWKSRE